VLYFIIPEIFKRVFRTVHFTNSTL